MGEMGEPYVPNQPYQPQQPGQRVDVTPRKRWYVIAIVLAVLGLVVGCGGFLLTLKIISDAMPEDGMRFESGVAAQVSLGAGDERVVYVALPYNANPGDATPPNTTTCTADAGLTLDKVSAEVKLADGTAKRTWQAVYTLKAAQAGTYALTCEQQDGTRATYGVGLMPWGGAVATSIGAFLLIFGVPCVCLVAAVVIVIVVAVRRRSNRKRLAGA